MKMVLNGSSIPKREILVRSKKRIGDSTHTADQRRHCASLPRMVIRAGPQSQKWSNQQITLNPTGSIHKKAREKKFDPKKVDFDEGVFI